ncbi:hypothetical protein ABIE62_000038 [Porphyrobacter sp. MBR-155]|uniref:hypothetical protein n=1 Tax=Porphyrobacter sp. MBR-155 TaxID=3156464 RepID=UPI00339B81E8
MQTESRTLIPALMRTTGCDGGKSRLWFDQGMEVSAYHHNVHGEFLMLRPGLFAARPRHSRFRNFRFTALDD